MTSAVSTVMSWVNAEVSVSITVCVVSSMTTQALAYHRLWNRLLQGSGAASGGTLQVGTSRTV